MLPSGFRKALFWSLYLAGVLLFFEGSARLIFWARPEGLGNDEASWRLRWIHRQTRAQRLTFSFDVYHPTRGWALKPDLRDVPVFLGKRLNSNSRGIRGEVEHDYEKPPGRTRILAFGDSFTFGEDVNDYEAYPAQLEDLLPGTEVLNFGVHGYGHDQMLLYFQEEGARYHPDVVVLGFLGLDMVRNIVSFRDYAKPRFDLLDGRLVLRNTPVPRPKATVTAERRRSRFVDLLTMIGWGLRERAQEEAARRVTAAILHEFKRGVEAAGARLVIAYLPTFGELKPGDESDGERFISAFCGDRGVTLVDLRPYFLERRAAGVQLKAKGHWNRTEHRLAAEGLRAAVEQAARLRDRSR